MQFGAIGEQCAICGHSRQPGETWFIITQIDQDRCLKVWKWDRRMVGENAAHAVCGARHARELVLHWMATGCLHYPFAASPFIPVATKSHSSPQPLLGPSRKSMPMELGELGVDREAVQRAFRENPLSLNTILDELTVILENELSEEAEASDLTQLAQ